MKKIIFVIVMLLSVMGTYSQNPNKIMAKIFSEEFPAYRGKVVKIFAEENGDGKAYYQYDEDTTDKAKKADVDMIMDKFRVGIPCIDDWAKGEGVETKIYFFEEYKKMIIFAISKEHPRWVIIWVKDR